MLILNRTTTSVDKRRAGHCLAYEHFFRDWKCGKRTPSRQGPCMNGFLCPVVMIALFAFSKIEPRFFFFSLSVVLHKRARAR